MHETPVTTKEQILQLRSSLREFGFVNPVIVDKDLNIIAGHGRIMAAKEEGLNEIPCVFVEHLTEAQKKAYILADNRLALSAGWDEELLVLEFTDLKYLGFDLELTGFDAKEIEKSFSADGNDIKDDDFDLTAALEQAAFVLPGDVWTLGRHRLICGDATNADTVKKLMDGRKANLVLTDPPYNVGFESASGLKIKNDNMKAEHFFSFLLASFRNLADNLEGGGSAYISHADTEGENFRRAFREAGFHLSGTCIWVKDSFVMGRSPCFLLNLGFIGDDYKVARKILLSRLDGNCSFKSGNRPTYTAYCYTYPNGVEGEAMDCTTEEFTSLAKAKAYCDTFAANCSGIHFAGAHVEDSSGKYVYELPVD